jgi:nucleoside-diphosphate-sugar epimerase
VDSAPRLCVIVTGATGLVGHYLLPLLMERGFAVQAVSRQPRPQPTAGPGTGAPQAGVDVRVGSLAAPGEPRRSATIGAPWAALWTKLDLDGPGAGAGAAGFGSADCLVHAAPIWLLPPWLPRAAEAGVRRLVAVSSTSRFTKQGSGSSKERETVRRLAEAEAAVEEACRERGIRWTILRPTLVYGGGRDRNVSDVARFVARFGFFPIAGRGTGRRQPVHGADVAAAALEVLDKPATFDRAYATPGGETLPYAEMVSRIARGIGRTPRLVHLPLPLVRGALAAASFVPGLGHVTPDMADRMDEDLVFDLAPARRDFGYDPRPFRFPDEPGDGAV